MYHLSNSLKHFDPLDTRKMYKSSKTNMGRRARNILRLALLWTRKGGLFALKKRLMLSHFHHSNKHTGALQNGDRQFSFDSTPIIHVKMHRPNSMRFHLPHIPCINPQIVDSDIFDFDYESDQSPYSYDQPRHSLLLPKKEDQEDDERLCEGEEIDVKAEEFIAKFYDQLKLQRQISYLKYNKN